MKGYIFLVFTCWFANQTVAQVNAIPANNRDSNMVKQLFFAGLREKLTENYGGASGNFSKVINLDPKNDAAYFELANANLRLGKFPEAEQAIKQAIFLKPDNTWYLRLLAEVYKRGNKMAELVSVYNELIRIEPGNDIFYFDKANAQYLANQPEEAKKTYNDIELKFGDSRALSRARQRFQQNGAANDSDLVKLLEGNQADVKNYLYAAGLLLQKNNEGEALKVLLKAQQIEPANYEVNLGLADIYRKQKNDEAAFLSLRKAFESEEMPLNDKVKIVAALFPKIAQPIVSENVSFLSKQLVEKNPENAKVLALYGDVLYQQNKLTEALIQYQASLSQKYKNLCLKNSKNEIHAL